MPHHDSNISLPRMAFEQYLRSQKMRCTPERRAIADAAAARSGLFTADELYESMRHDGYFVSRATVYSTLALLNKATLMRSHKTDSGATRYETAQPTPATGTRVLIICNECGSVRITKDPGIQQFFSATTRMSFAITHCTLYVHGLCARCRRKSRSNQTNNTNQNKPTNRPSKK